MENFILFPLSLRKCTGIMANKWRWEVAQFAELKWWENYLKDKKVEDYLLWKRNYWQDLWNQCQIPLANHWHILDAGCGPSGMFMIFPDHPCVAFDPLIEEYEKNLPHFTKQQYPRVHFVKAGLEDFQSNQTFDLIFCMNAINHVQDIHQSLKNLCSHASSGAKIVISIDAHNYSIFKFLFRLLPGDILHPHQYDLKEYLDLIKENHCTIDRYFCLKKEFFFDHYVLVATKK